MTDSLDYSILRDSIIRMHNLSHMDDIYTFFYDETNNSRLFRITDGGFNSSKDEDFVLGGLAYEGSGKAFEMDDLLRSLKIQPSMNEIKRKNIAPGNTFLECMNSVKLQALLEWITENNIFVHFMIMNNLYYGIA